MPMHIIKKRETYYIYPPDSYIACSLKFQILVPSIEKQAIKIYFVGGRDDSKM